MTKNYKINQTIYLFVVSMLFVSVAGCATSKSQFSKRLYEVDEIKEISSNVEINATSSNNEWNVVPILENSLEQELEKRNYIITKEKSDSIKLNVHIEHFNEGSQGARLTIGQIIPGVGGCSLDYSLTIINKSNDKILIKNKEKIRYSSFDPNLALLDEYSVIDYLGDSETVTNRMVKMATEKILKAAGCWE